VWETLCSCVVRGRLGLGSALGLWPALVGWPAFLAQAQMVWSAAGSLGMEREALRRMVVTPL
jgi:hypothetical protein